MVFDEKIRRLHCRISKLVFVSAFTAEKNENLQFVTPNTCYTGHTIDITHKIEYAVIFNGITKVSIHSRSLQLHNSIITDYFAIFFYNIVVVFGPCIYADAVRERERVKLLGVKSLFNRLNGCSCCKLR